ncbi:SDR family NAD(P)-dependent oxidoreductase [Hymenobacter sp. GOD-10R]|uniref:SDR family NAD(P)-dependent oxidoreductase n=1 Tax=Hymenobacter sp. GOD-10R TaxID=3093922 RepID=UPI002D788518|nr:SDR family NAD(P)-dependent oxidoreductase [Hymenobacter sp. GOD-10R]WRQ29776.1 SDR family NAD(P)-dependent oxidoreductase [Hymenobacter sp. GOD-10R]
MHYYIITGASRGLGKALAEAILTEDNTKVIGVARHATIEHDRYHHQPLDLSDSVAVENNLSKVFVQWVDIESITLINNAGVLGEIGYLGEQPNEHFDFVFTVNTIVPAMFMNTFLSAYASYQVPRTILNISSGAAQRPVDGWGAYCASKAALEMMTRTARKEQAIRASGIRIRAISPGVIDTAMQEQIRTIGEQQFSEVERFIKLQADKQLQMPEQVANKILNWVQQPASESEEVVLQLKNM